MKVDKKISLAFVGKITFLVVFFTIASCENPESNKRPTNDEALLIANQKFNAYILTEGLSFTDFTLTQRGYNKDVSGWEILYTKKNSIDDLVNIIVYDDGSIELHTSIGR